MPWTLYRLILIDLFRIILLTTGILVTVIAFGAAIKPLANDRLLNAAQTAKYIGLVIVPMLQYALPFAAGFGATLSFHRMTADNEIQAMAASGISYRRIMLPVVALGVALTILMIVLTQSVIPRFWTLIVHTVAEDVTRVFQASIGRGEAFQIGKMQVYADQLVIQEQPEGPDGPETRMILLNVAAADLDESGRIVTDVTARDAVVDVYRRENQTFLKMVMNDTVASNAQTGQLVYSQRFAPQRAIAVPIAASESLKVLTLSRLFAVRKNPELHTRVAEARESLADALRNAEVRQLLAERLASTGVLEFHDQSGAAPGGRTYVVHAERLSQGGRFVASDGRPVEVVQHENGVATVRLMAASVELASPTEPQSGQPIFDLVIGEHDVINLMNPSGTVNRRALLVLSSVATAERDDDRLEILSIVELIDQAQRQPSTPATVSACVERLHTEIHRVQRGIIGTLAMRNALCITAILLLLLGALMAMWHRGGMPLATYAWAFVPSIADLILISAGEQMLRSDLWWGHGVMWSGNVILLLICLMTAIRVSKN